MFGCTAFIVLLLRKFFIQFDLNHDDQTMLRRDYKLAFMVLMTNILVGFLGFFLLKFNFIVLSDKTLLFAFVDLFVLMALVDVGMYLMHFFVHKTFLYRYLHGIHHEHESMTTLSLYVMHPLEALGFGLILITILMIYPTSILGLLIFIFVNWILGVFAHSGIEPSRGELANYICMTRFHQIHHENPKSNFGFYTPLLDMLFKTRCYELKSER
jgi:sterol desaturase/sphingolipid hydroxylase (fatty acid hydroxylase superfamily)